MTGEQSIEIIFFDGCPNVNIARDNLRSALQWEGKDTTWTEWDLFADLTPKHLRRGWVNRCVNVSGGILPLLG